MFSHVAQELNASFSTYVPSPNDSMDLVVEIVPSSKNYKTELCRTWIAKNFCPYNEKCRFAHGNRELHDKVIFGRFYKQKKCKSFYETGICKYGSRCHFKHEQRRLGEISRTFYELQLSRFSDYLPKNQNRLPAFQKITATRRVNPKNNIIKLSPQHLLLMKRAFLKTFNFY